MTLSIMSSVSSTGRLTIPHQLRARLGLRGGSKVALQEVTDGVILTSVASLSRSQIIDADVEEICLP